MALPPDSVIANAPRPRGLQLGEGGMDAPDQG